MPSLLGSDTNGASSQGGVPWVHMGLPSSVDRLSGTSSSTSSSSLSSLAINILVQITAHVLAYTNSCLNPLLYAKMSNNFRRGFSQVNGVTFSCDLFNLDLDLSLMLEEEGKQCQFKRATHVKASQKKQERNGNSCILKD